MWSILETVLMVEGMIRIRGRPMIGGMPPTPSAPGQPVARFQRPIPGRDFGEVRDTDLGEGNMH